MILLTCLLADVRLGYTHLLCVHNCPSLHMSIDEIYIDVILLCVILLSSNVILHSGTSECTPFKRE